jgi:hypothetical protein
MGRDSNASENCMQSQMTAQMTLICFVHELQVAAKRSAKHDCRPPWWGNQCSRGGAADVPYQVAGECGIVV